MPAARVAPQVIGTHAREEDRITLFMPSCVCLSVCVYVDLCGWPCAYLYIYSRIHSVCVPQEYVLRLATD